MKNPFVIVPRFVLGLIFLTSCASAQNVSPNRMDDHHPGSEMRNSLGDSEMQDWAKARLAKSPRHQEWVKIKYQPAGGTAEREVSAFVVYPEVRNKATSVLVIHEIFGMSDWVQSHTDQLAEAGYIAIAPDLLSGMGPNGGGTNEIRATDSNAVGKAIRDLLPAQITADLNAVADYVTKLPAANGKLAVTGYCWGGTQAFRYATNNTRLKAAFVFYGSAPESKDELAKIKAPVYGFYAGNDARIGATLPKTIEMMKELGKKYEPVTYDGAGHGFMRAGDAPDPKAPEPKGDKVADEKAAADFQKALVAYKANVKARDEAWQRWKAILRKL